jgi:hypothetical protein
MYLHTSQDTPSSAVILSSLVLSAYILDQRKSQDTLHQVILHPIPTPHHANKNTLLRQAQATAKPQHTESSTDTQPETLTLGIIVRRFRKAQPTHKAPCEASGARSIRRMGNSYSSSQRSERLFQQRSSCGEECAVSGRQLCV